MNDTALTELKNHPISEIFPLMDDKEYEIFKADINANGLLQPICLHPDGRILDGRNRYKACMELGIEPKFETWNKQGSLVMFVVSMNLHRRHLNSSQRAVIAMEIEPILAKEAKERQRQAGQQYHKGSPKPKETKATKVTQKIAEPISESAEQAAKVVGTNKQYVKDVKKIKETAPEKIADISTGKKTISQVKKEIKKEADKKERTMAAKKLSKVMPSGGIVSHGDFRQVGESVADNSCTLIFTDPPYDRESLPLFESLGEFANRVLVDGGSMITFCGQYVMDEVMQILGKHLRYFWVCCCLHTGDTAAMREYGIKVKWKPMLWYVKGKFRYDREVWVDDLVKSQQEKDHHPWQQSVIEAKHFIETLTRDGDLVCDPFCGGGTTAFAAKELKRKFWTCDVDARHIQTAKERLDAAV